MEKRVRTYFLEESLMHHWLNKNYHTSAKCLDYSMCVVFKYSLFWQMGSTYHQEKKRNPLYLGPLALSRDWLLSLHICIHTCVCVCVCVCGSEIVFIIIAACQIENSKSTGTHIRVYIYSQSIPIIISSNDILTVKKPLK